MPEFFPSLWGQLIFLILTVLLGIVGIVDLIPPLRSRLPMLEGLRLSHYLFAFSVLLNSALAAMWFDLRDAANQRYEALLRRVDVVECNSLLVEYRRFCDSYDISNSPTVVPYPTKKRLDEILNAYRDRFGGRITLQFEKLAKRGVSIDDEYGMFKDMNSVAGMRYALRELEIGCEQIARPTAP